LGNPALKPGAKITLKTRFKSWWKLVGSAVERGAELLWNARGDGAIKVDFGQLFLGQEDDDEDNVSLAEALEAFKNWWPSARDANEKTPGFSAADVAGQLNNKSISVSSDDLERANVVRLFLFLEMATKGISDVSAKAVGRRLQDRLGEPVFSGDNIL